MSGTPSLTPPSNLPPLPLPMGGWLGCWVGGPGVKIRLNSAELEAGALLFLTTYMEYFASYMKISVFGTSFI